MPSGHVPTGVERFSERIMRNDTIAACGVDQSPRMAYDRGAGIRDASPIT
jgi:hypothetical protein